MLVRQGSPTGTPRRLTAWELRQELEQRERDRRYAELMSELVEARETGAGWYQWVADGRPVLTEAEYARVGRNGRGRNRSAESPRNRGKEEPSTGSRDAQGTLA